MSRLRLSRSLDGVHRTELRVGFRIDQTDLVKGLLYSLEVRRGTRLLQKNDGAKIGDWSRSSVLRATRASLRELGELGMISEAGVNVGPKTRALAERKVRALFPEFYGG